MKKTLIFYILLILSGVLFIFNLIKLPKLETSLYPIFPPVYNTVNVIIDAPSRMADDIILNADNNYFSIPSSRNVLNKRLNGKIDNLNILISDEYKNAANADLIIFNDIKAFYFKDFSKFEKERTQLCPNGICKNYTKYKIPTEAIKYNKNSKSINFHSIQNTICAYILALLSGSFLFFIPYFLLFAAVLCKPEPLHINLRAKYFIFPVFILAILMFSNGIFDYLPWVDEYRTIEYSDPSKPLSNLFSDPGNPPLFYILFRIFTAVFGISIYTMKLFPFIISILAVICLWWFLKDKFDIKTANLAAFLAAINVPFVYYALETRCYILQMLFTPLLAFLLFKILDNNKAAPLKKYFILYGIMAALASNTHYYEILLLIANFIFAFIYLILQKRYKDILYFLMSNIFAAACFLPFFIMTAYNKALSVSTFNDWIPAINYFQIKKCVFYIFGGGVSFILSGIFFIKTFFEKEDIKRKFVIIYSYFAIIFTVFQGILLSYIIRPMLVERYLVLLSPLFMIFLASIFTLKYKKKAVLVLFIIWVLLIQANSFEKNNRRKGLIELPLSLSKEFYTQNRGNISAIINFSNPEYLENKDDYIKEGIHYYSKSVHDSDIAVDEILSKDKNAVIFTNIIDPDKQNSNLPDNYKCYFNSSVDMCLWKVTN